MLYLTILNSKLTQSSLRSKAIFIALGVAAVVAALPVPATGSSLLPGTSNTIPAIIDASLENADVSKRWEWPWSKGKASDKEGTGGWGGPDDNRDDDLYKRS